MEGGKRNSRPLVGLLRPAAEGLSLPAPKGPPRGSAQVSPTPEPSRCGGMALARTPPVPWPRLLRVPSPSHSPPPIQP